MNRYLINGGGQPIYLDDLQFIQDAVADTFKGVLLGLKLGSLNMLLNNPVTTTSTMNGILYQVGENGYIIIAEEVYPIKTGNLEVAQGTKVYWKVISEKYQTEIQNNNTEVQVYERKYVQLSTTYVSGDIYVEYNKVSTFKEEILSCVVNYLNEPESTTDMQAQLPVSDATCAMTYIRKQVGTSCVQFRLLAGLGMNLTEVNGKRRLCTYNNSIINSFSAIVNAKYLTDPNDESKFNTYTLTFDNGNCYASDLSGNPVPSLPSGAMNVTINI